jgi:hypothetical protein
MANRGIYINRNGAWEEVQIPSIKQDDTWKDIQKGFVKKDGEWKQFYPSSGTVEYSTPGAYTFKVPPGIRSITVDLAGAGGGGGGSSEVGAGGGGGGGGSGGNYIGQTLAVVPGETITIQVGGGGAGAPYVGRTTGAPAGATGGTTTISGSFGSLSAAGGGGGGGGTGDGGGGGGKIICTKLYELGLMDRTIYEADQAFGAVLVKQRPDIYNGYRAWAEIVVDWMDGNGPNMMPWLSDERRREITQRWSTTWAQDIATPWAEEMAFNMGKKDSGSLTGRLITAVGIPICKAVGVWQRVFGPSKKSAGFGKGLMLIPVFVMFKLVAEFGRLIERNTTCTV